MMPKKRAAGPIVVGLMGGIGCGKSTIARMFRRLGAPVMDADRVAHQVLIEPGVRRRLKRLWGGQILGPHGIPDRRRISGLVFRDPNALARLEAILHPGVTRLMLRSRRLKKPMVVWDAALLAEKGFHRYCDALVFVDSSPAVRLGRVRAVRRWSGEELKRRERFQMGLNKKRRLADYIIDNNHSKSAAWKQVRAIYKKIMRPVTG